MVFILVFDGMTVVKPGGGGGGMLVDNFEIDP